MASARNLVIAACAASAGIHAALTPEHFREGAGPGAGFLAASVLLAVLAVALTRRPGDAGALLATTTGLPLLHPEVEPVDALALATKAIEAAALLASVGLLRPKGTTT